MYNVINIYINGFLNFKINFIYFYFFLIGFQLRQNLYALEDNRVQSLGQEDALEKGIATHSSILAGRILWREEPGRLQSITSKRVEHDRETNTLQLVLPILYSNSLFSSDYTSLQVITDNEYNSLCYSVNPCCLSILHISVPVQSTPCPALCNPVDCSTPDFLVHHQLPDPAQTHVHQVGEDIQLSHPSSPSPSAFSLSQQQGLFQ